MCKNSNAIAKRVNDGFAIRCPHCGNWDEHPQTHPSEVAVTISKVEEIMGDFQSAVRDKQADSFLDNRMFRCPQPHWICPAPYEAFIFSDESEAQSALKMIHKKWAISRDFRLYKNDKKKRWDRPEEKYKYYCIMFWTEPVRRLRDIELEHLVQPRLIGKMIRGLRHEIQAPLTIYSANILEGKKAKGKNPYWMPVEAYSRENPLVPSGYNEFCKTCRKIVMAEIESEFKEKFNEGKIEPKNCPSKYWDEQYKRCAGRKPACEVEPVDWNHCPAFIDEREKRCFCYNSDLMLIKTVKKQWSNGTSPPSTSSRQCPAKFIEEGLPIIVHEHLVGVAMAGQMFYEIGEIANVNEFMKNANNLLTGQNPLVGHEKELKIARHGLFWTEECKKQKDIKDQASIQNKRARFLIREEDLKYRVGFLKQNVKMIEDVVEARYRDIRSRSEIAFRDELIGFTQHSMVGTLLENRSGFFKGEGDDVPIVWILKRMCEFWAFKASGFLWWDLTDNPARLVGYSAEARAENNKGLDERSEGFGFKEGLEVCKIQYNNTLMQEHPVSWLKDPKNKPYEKYPPQNPLLKEICTSIECSEVFEKLALPRDADYFVILVPFQRNIYSFAFLSRDEKNVSRTPGEKSLVVSELCQEFMLRTCTEMVHELWDVRFHRERKQQLPSQKIKAVKQRSRNQKLTGIADVES